MCNLGSFFDHAIGNPVKTFVDRATTAPGSGGQAALLEQQRQQAAQEAADAAALVKQQADSSAAVTAQLTAQNDIASRSLDLQKTAIANAAATAVPAADSESARLAGEARMRRLIAASGGASSGKNYLGAAPTGYRMLTGA